LEETPKVGKNDGSHVEGVVDADSDGPDVVVGLVASSSVPDGLALLVDLGDQLGLSSLKMQLELG